MTITRNHKLIGCFILAILAALMSFATYVSAQPSTVVIQTMATATTSVAFLTPGTATTTYQFDNSLFSSGKIANMQSVDSGSMMIQMTASSSVGNLSTLAWQFQFSNNGIDWYGESSPVTAAGASASAESTSTITHTWNPGTTATSSKFVLIPVGPAQHERVTFFIPGTPNTTASSSAFYIEVDLKKNPSTP